MKKLHDRCTVENCSFEHHARGLCATHYAQLKRGVTQFGAIRTRVAVKPDECIEDGCCEPVKAKGLCKMHYQRLLRHGHTKRKDRSKPFDNCSVDGCTHVLYSNGMCSNHYQKSRVLKKLGISFDDYLTMLKEQNGVCKICKQPETTSNGHSGKIKDLAVDHCHTSGKVRGLLCSSCNSGLGLFKDDVSVLKSAIEYLSL